MPPFGLHAEPIVPYACIKVSPVNATTGKPLPLNATLRAANASLPSAVNGSTPASTPTPEALAWRRDWSVPAKGDGCFPALSGLERPLVGMEMVEQGMVGASPSGEPRRGLIWRTER